MFSLEDLPVTEPLGIAMYPQVYELIWNLLVFAVLWRLLRGRLMPSGSLFAAYLALYSPGSFLIRFLRGDVSYFVGILNEGKLILLLVLALITATGFLITRFRASRRLVWRD
jgi:prolipoprotein diacylglyceryltransferase